MENVNDFTLPGESPPAPFRIAGVSFDVSRNLLRNDSGSRHLAPREASVLAVLVQAPRGSVITRMQLLDSVWGESDVGDEALTVVVSRLRRHFRVLGVRKPLIETVPKVGYRLTTGLARARRFDDPLRIPARADGLARAALSVAILALGVALASLLLELL